MYQTATAAIGTTTLAAPKDSSLMRGDINDINDEPVIDHNKIKCAKTKLMNTIRQESNQIIRNTGIAAILFDGRKDNTKFKRSTIRSALSLAESI